MSASTLRAAARLIRERAEGATPGPWVARRDSGTDLHFGSMEFTTLHAADPTAFRGEKNLFSVAGMPLSTADHIASWHPDVALAVADLIDTILNVGPVDGGAEWDATVNLARTYLGGSA